MKEFFDNDKITYCVSDISETAETITSDTELPDPLNPFKLGYITVTYKQYKELFGEII